MLTAEARRRLTIVLVGARNPQNIGAAARAMQDFGFSHLRVVNPFAPPFEAAQMEAAQFEAAQMEAAQFEAAQMEASQIEATSAVGAGEVMRSARLFASLAEAIADCTLVVGTTAIGERGLRLPVHGLRDAAPQLRKELISLDGTRGPKEGQLDVETEVPAATGSRVALLFGSEKTGLTNQQLSHCSLLLTIPLFSPEGRHLSMNLGQSVAVCLYELSREGFEGERALPVTQQTAATAADRERLTQLLLDLMQGSGYARRFPANARLEVVRQLIGSLGQSRAEAVTWMGFLKHLVQATSRTTDVQPPNANDGQDP